MQAAAVALRERGRPPTYDLVYALGECHREFLRLASELTKRAESLSVSLPPLDTQGGISELARLLESSLGGVVPELPPAPVAVEVAVAEEWPEEVAVAMPAPVEPVASAPDPVEESPPPDPVKEPPPPEPAPEPLEGPPADAAEDPRHPGESVRLSALGPSTRSRG